MIVERAATKTTPSVLTGVTAPSFVPVRRISTKQSVHFIKRKYGLSFALRRNLLKCPTSFRLGHGGSALSSSAFRVVPFVSFALPAKKHRLRKNVYSSGDGKLRCYNCEHGILENDASMR